MSRGIDARIPRNQNMANSKPRKPRLAWALTGSGHDFTECLELMVRIGAMDVFVSKAAAEVIYMYRRERQPFPRSTKIIKDTSASAAPVGRFYHGHYHTLVLAPTTSNTVAKCVLGISDTLITNVFAQAGKCRVPVIVYACDTLPEMDTMAPDRMVHLWPRRIDLENTEKLRSFENTTVVTTLAELESAVTARLEEVECSGDRP